MSLPTEVPQILRQKSGAEIQSPKAKQSEVLNLERPQSHTPIIFLMADLSSGEEVSVMSSSKRYTEQEVQLHVCVSTRPEAAGHGSERYHTEYTSAFPNMTDSGRRIQNEDFD